MKPTLKQVRKLLEKKYEYDFSSDFWNDDNLVIIEEVFNATIELMEKESR